MKISINYTKLSVFVVLCLITLILPLKAAAEDLFPVEITSVRWAQYGQCDAGMSNFFVFSGGFRGNEIMCASTDSRRDSQIFYLFMECAVGGKLATYMGNALYSEWFIEINMTEYRGATGAPDIYIELERCKEKI